MYETKPAAKRWNNIEKNENKKNSRGNVRAFFLLTVRCSRECNWPFLNEGKKCSYETNKQASGSSAPVIYNTCMADSEYMYGYQMHTFHTHLIYTDAISFSLVRFFSRSNSTLVIVNYDIEEKEWEKKLKRI